MTQPEIEKLLIQNAFKVTDKRVAILYLLVKIKLPLTISDIQSKLPQKLKIDLATIYRNIEAFVAAGLIKSLSLQKGVTHYEYTGGHAHHHLVCLNCHRIEDFLDCNAQAISESVLSKSKLFNSITSHNFELFGICNVCSK